jgi:hypothetical protein
MRFQERPEPLNGRPINRLHYPDPDNEGERLPYYENPTWPQALVYLGMRAQGMYWRLMIAAFILISIIPVSCILLVFLYNAFILYQTAGKR